MQTVVVKNRKSKYGSSIKPYVTYRLELDDTPENDEDRLKQAFMDLRKNYGYITRYSASHCSMACRTCTGYDISQSAKYKKMEKENNIRYVYFTAQGDPYKEAAKRSSWLRKENASIWLSWAGDGQTIVDVLKKHDLEADWDGDPKRSIEVKVNA